MIDREHRICGSVQDALVLLSARSNPPTPNGNVLLSSEGATLQLPPKRKKVLATMTRLYSLVICDDSSAVGQRRMNDDTFLICPEGTVHRPEAENKRTRTSTHATTVRSKSVDINNPVYR